MNEIVGKNPASQLTIELAKDGLADSVGAGGEPAEAVKRLRELRTRWDTLSWTGKVIYGVEGSCNAYELVGGMFIKTDSDGNILIVKLPTSKDPLYKVVANRNLEMRPGDFALDASQDLIVFLNIESGPQPAHDRRRASVRVHSLSNFKPHPEAATPTLYFAIDSDAVWGNSIHRAITQVAGDLIATFICAGTSSRLLIWNWKTGKLVTDSKENSLLPYSYAFSFVLPSLFYVTSLSDNGVIVIYSVDPSGAATGFTHIASLHLPPLQDNSAVQMFGCHTEPFQAKSASDRFPTVLEKQLHVLTLTYISVTDFSQSNYQLVAPASLFIGYHDLLQRRASEFPITAQWDDWGPFRTRFFPTPDTYHWLRYVHGQRVVAPSNIDQTIYVLDFNIHPNAPASQADASSSLRHAEFTPTTVPPGNVFCDNVVSRLPFYFLTKCGALNEDFDGFMIDQERIVAISGNISQEIADQDNPDVFSPSYVRSQSSSVVSGNRADQVTQSQNADLERRAQNSQSTPARAGGVMPPPHSPTTRAVAEKQIAQDLSNRRWKSSDLVAHTFGKAIPTKLSVCILLAFLQLGVIEARKIDGDQSTSLAQPKDWVSLCLHAALDSHAKHTSRSTSKKGKRPPEEKDSRKYSWAWAKKLEDELEGKGVEKGMECEEKAAAFFNVVGILAFLVACQVDPSFKTRYPYRNRFATPPFVHQNIMGAYGQASRADIFSLPLRAFRASDLSEQGEPCAKTTSPVSVIRKFLRGNLQPSPNPPPPAVPQSDSLQSPSGNVAVPSSSSAHDRGPAPSPQTQATVPVRAPLSDNSAQELLKETLQKQLNAPYRLSTESTDLLPALDHEYLCNKYVCFQGFGATGEVKTRELLKAVQQELVYMQQHGMAQPHLRYVLGLAKADLKITFIREDAIGTEEVTLDGKLGSGMLEIIQLALGLGVATSEMLGADPAFEMSDDREVSLESKEDTPVVSNVDVTKVSVETGGASLPPTESGTSGGKRKRGATTASSSKHPRLTPPLNYWAPSPVFFNINKQRYFLDHLAQGRRSITGRQTRVWCAYLELEPGDIQDAPPKRDGSRVFPSIHKDDLSKAKALLASKSRVFVGPYALKIQYADMDSPAMTNNIVENIQDIMKRDPEKGCKYLLVPEWNHRGDEVISAIRGFESVPPTVEKKYIRRQELVSVSLFKRTLGHYCSLGEVCRAVADGYRAILWLHENGYVHRDLSDGNLLLARETPTTFTGPHSTSVQYGGRNEAITLIRRQPHEPQDVFGLVHDLDMAALVQVLQPDPSPPLAQIPSAIGTKAKRAAWREARKARSVQPQQEQLTRKNEEARLRHRTGTPPYMSVRILLGKAAAHCVRDDAESLFYVLYLFPFQHPLPANQCMYPGPLPRSRVALPGPIKKWAGGWNQDLEVLGAMKQIFFRNKEAVSSEIQSLDPLWMAANRAFELEGLDYLVTELFECSIDDHIQEKYELGDLDSLVAILKKIDDVFDTAENEEYHVPGLVATSSS
ncbi:hypothetical protein MD484_g1534, partial [Candolleomyces efflorescens]